MTKGGGIMTKYTTIAGDMWDGIAYKTLGDEAYTDKLMKQNPEYRRRGIATALESAAINRELQEGHVPYCHLYTDNLASRALQQSLGLSFADKNVWWLEND